VKLQFDLTKKEWINKLAPIAQAKLWNKTEHETQVSTDTYKFNSKWRLLKTYGPLPDYLITQPPIAGKTDNDAGDADDESDDPQPPIHDDPSAKKSTSCLTQ